MRDAPVLLTGRTRGGISVRRDQRINDTSVLK